MGAKSKKVVSSNLYYKVFSVFTLFAIASCVVMLYSVRLDINGVMKASSFGRRNMNVSLLNCEFHQAIATCPYENLKQLRALKVVGEAKEMKSKLKSFLDSRKMLHRFLSTFSIKDCLSHFVNDSAMYKSAYRLDYYREDESHAYPYINIFAVADTVYCFALNDEEYCEFRQHITLHDCAALFNVRDSMVFEAKHYIMFCMCKLHLATEEMAMSRLLDAERIKELEDDLFAIVTNVIMPYEDIVFSCGYEKSADYVFNPIHLHEDSVKDVLKQKYQSLYESLDEEKMPNQTLKTTEKGFFVVNNSSWNDLISIFDVHLSKRESLFDPDTRGLHTVFTMFKQMDKRTKKL